MSFHFMASDRQMREVTQIYDIIFDGLMPVMVDNRAQIDILDTSPHRCTLYKLHIHIPCVLYTFTDGVSFFFHYFRLYMIISYSSRCADRCGRAAVMM